MKALLTQHGSSESSEVYNVESWTLIFNLLEKTKFPAIAAESLQIAEVMLQRFPDDCETSDSTSEQKIQRNGETEKLTAAQSLQTRCIAILEKVELRNKSHNPGLDALREQIMLPAMVESAVAGLVTSAKLIEPASSTSAKVESLLMPFIQSEVIIIARASSQALNEISNASNIITSSFHGAAEADLQQFTDTGLETEHLQNEQDSLDSKIRTTKFLDTIKEKSSPDMPLSSRRDALQALHESGIAAHLLWGLLHRSIIQTHRIAGQVLLANLQYNNRFSLEQHTGFYYTVLYMSDDLDSLCNAFCVAISILFRHTYLSEFLVHL